MEETVETVFDGDEMEAVVAAEEAAMAGRGESRW